jgi:hypothetical protein
MMVNVSTIDRVCGSSSTAGDRSMRRIIIAALFLTAISLPAAARVERIEILSRQDFASGVEFGDGGAYEKLRPRLLRA